MKWILAAVTMVLLFYSLAISGDRTVRGHWKDTDRDGVKDTYVEPYHRTEPNNTRMDNYNTRGNYNPYTGREGTQDPFKQNNPYQQRRNPYSYDKD